MKIVADENIPLIQHYFGHAGDLILKPGRAITCEDLRDADILLIRSVTQVNEALLQGTAVKFVGSTTTGFDHIDTEYLDKKGIRWAVAAGCNAVAVVEYILCVIAALQKKGLLLTKNLTACVIGVGRIGRQVVDLFQSFGFTVIQCDPLRAEYEKDYVSIALEDLPPADLITLHTPLTQNGKYPTYHMIAKEFLQKQKSGGVLINAGRGSVIDFSDLKLYGKHLNWCLDVWENEPHIDLEVLQSCLIATPHIAGYSVESKWRGIEMIYRAARHLGVITDQHIPDNQFPSQNISLNQFKGDWRDGVLQVWDPDITTQQMKKMLNNEETFDHLRKNFVDRHELAYRSK